MDIPQERKIVTEIPGPRSREWFERRDRGRPAGRRSTSIRSSRRGRPGAIIEDVDGNRLIDFATGIAVLNVGHTAPEVVAAAQRQLELDTHTCFHVTANEPYIELAERLNALAPGDAPKKTMFANSGRRGRRERGEDRPQGDRPTRRSSTFDHAFHGRTLIGMSLTAKVMPYKQGMGPFAPEIYRLPFAYPYRWPTAGPSGAPRRRSPTRVDEMHKHIGEENIAAVIARADPGRGRLHRPGARASSQGLAEFCARARDRVHRRRDPERDGPRRPLVRDRGRGRRARHRHEREVARRRPADQRDHRARRR